MSLIEMKCAYSSNTRTHTLIYMGAYVYMSFKAKRRPRSDSGSVVFFMRARLVFVACISLDRKWTSSTSVRPTPFNDPQDE